MYSSTGILRYYDGWLIALIDQELVRYYRNFLKRKILTNPQMYNAHISVIRKEVIDTSNELWGKYEGKEISFYYDGIIRNGEIYYWVNCYSKELENIRAELGLENIDKYNPVLPGDYKKTFHFTIGNLK